MLLVAAPVGRDLRVTRPAATADVVAALGSRLVGDPGARLSSNDATRLCDHVVVMTGDVTAAPSAHAARLDAPERLLDRPGVRGGELVEFLVGVLRPDVALPKQGS